MRTFSFIVILAFISTQVLAQTDEHPDYRSKRELFKRIQEPDIRSDLAAFSMGGIEESVGKLPLRTLPISKAGSNFISFAGENISVEIKAGIFVPAKHKLGFYDEKYLVKIDNKGYFGDYGKLPKTTIEQVRVIVNRDTVYVPQIALSDLYNPIFSYRDKGAEKSNNNVFFSADGKRMYVYMLKREAGGSYEVTWIFQDGKYLKRVVDYGFLK